jgi:hypothetical protein
MRRLLFPAMLAAVVTSAACAAAPVNRSLETYYDPAGLFSSELPDRHAVQVIPQGKFGADVKVLSGVSSADSQAGQTSGGIGGFAQGSSDQAQFIIYALSSKTLEGSGDVAALLTGDPALTVDDEEPFAFPDGDGVLVVGTYESDQGAFGLAGGFLVHDGLGYMVLELFPQGQWSAQEHDFREVLASFRAGAPAAVGTVPLPSAA